MSREYSDFLTKSCKRIYSCPFLPGECGSDVVNDYALRNGRRTPERQSSIELYPFVKILHDSPGEKCSLWATLARDSDEEILAST